MVDFDIFGVSGGERGREAAGAVLLGRAWRTGGREAGKGAYFRFLRFGCDFYGVVCRGLRQGRFVVFRYQFFGRRCFFFPAPIPPSERSYSPLLVCLPPLRDTLSGVFVSEPSQMCGLESTLAAALSGLFLFAGSRFSGFESPLSGKKAMSTH